MLVSALLPGTAARGPQSGRLANLEGSYAAGMLVNVGQAKTDLSKLLARVEAGEAVDIARDGVPVARLTRIERPTSGARFLAARGCLAGRISIADDFEFSDDELDDLLDDPT